MDIWQSAGHWYVNRDGKEYQFDSEMEARGFMSSEKPIELELAEKITTELLPQLRKLFGEMLEMQVAWEDNNMNEIIEEAALDGRPYVNVAGYSPLTWSLWGTTFRALTEWLDTPNEAIGGTKPRVVLMKRYTKES